MFQDYTPFFAFCGLFVKEKKMPLVVGQEYSAAMILKEYFGLKPDQNVMGFSNELKTLSEEEKNEMAVEAAKLLGVKIKAK